MSTEETDTTLRIDPEVNNKLNGYRAAANTIRNEIGGIEIQKFKMVGQLGEIERQAQSLLNHEAARLGIPNGQQWSVLPNGEVQVVMPPAGAVIPPPQPPAE